LIAAFAVIPRGQAIEPSRHATVTAGEKRLLWLGANYGPNCGSAGLPIFKLISAPALGEVTTERTPILVPSGKSCEGHTYTGLAIWYKARSQAGIDVFTYTLDFPHESGNPSPAKGPQTVTETVTVK
jgi:hypothetical protein